MRGILILFILVFWGYSASGQSSTSYDVEFSRICLIDSIAPDTLTQFWRFTQANNPGGITRDYSYDLSGAYNVAGTVVPCCSCLTAASDKATVEIPGAPGNNWGAIGFLTLISIIPFVLIFLLYMAEMKAARFACTIFFLTLIPVSQGFAQSETSYDVEFTCICLVDSIAADNIVQFWRFTQANNPGGITRDYSYDLSATYTVAGTVIGCKDYYLGDNPGGSGTAGTLAIWTGTETLGNSSLTESGEEAAWDLTGALTVPSGTDAQVPVWGAGKLRYNTTSNLFQGGNAGLYIPFLSSSINYSNPVSLINSQGQIITDNNGINYNLSQNELYINLNNDYGNYGLSVYEKGIYARNSGGYKSEIFGDKVIFTGSNGSYATLTVTNAQTGFGTLGARIIGGRVGLSTRSGDPETYPGIYLPGLLNNGGSAIAPGILFGQGEYWRSGTPFTSEPGYGRGIKWENWRTTSSVPAYYYEAANIIPVIVDNTEDSICVELRIYYHYEGDTIPGIILGDGVSLGKYGTGLISGLPVYSASFNANGKLIEVPEKWGAISTSTDGSGDITVAHGMGTTPTSVQVTVTGTTPYVVTVHSIDATNFTVRFYDMTGAAVTSTAVTATWHAKT